MGKVSQITLQFPFGGLAKRLAYQREGPFTSPSLSNVFADCSFEERQRGGSRPAIRKFFATQLGSGNPVRMVATVSYYDSSTGDLKTILVASANGKLYKEDAGDWTEVSTSLTLASDVMLHAVDYLGKLYIADYAVPVAEATDGATSSGVLTSASVGNFETAGVDADDHCVVITAVGAGDTTVGTYQIASVSGTDITLSTDPGDGTSLSFRVQRMPKVYDPDADTLTAWTATTDKGAVPTGYPLIGIFLDRIVMSGSPINQGEVLACRRGDPDDWLTGDTDVGSAWALTDTINGHLPEHVTQLIPHPDRCVIFGCHTSYYVLRGDPTYGGTAVSLSPNIGGLKGKAYAFDDRGWLWMMTQDGLYVMPQECGGRPRSVSRDVLPQDLLNISTSDDVTMEWDVRYRALHLYVTPSTGDGKQYWIDTRQVGEEWSASFFPYSLQTDHQATAIHAARNRRSDYSITLLGSKDGYVRRFEHDQDKDDGDNTITSHVDILLAAMGGDARSDGVLRELMLLAAGDSGSVNYAIRTGQSAESAFDAATNTVSGSFDVAGRNQTDRPMIRGPAAAIRLSNGEAKRWAMEGLVAVVEQKPRTIVE